MNKFLALIPMAAFALSGSAVSAADRVAAKDAEHASAKPAERVTAKEAEAMVRKAVSYIKVTPRSKAMADITDTKGQFVDRELYLTVYTLDGTALAHGANYKFVGKNMIEFRDGNGKEHIRERMELAKVKNAFWQDFTFVNPVNKKMEAKQMYCERVDDLVVCGGIYKPNA